MASLRSGHGAGSHSCRSPATNHRYWDLIDLLLQRELLGDDLIRVREACIETFAGRNLHSWPPELVVPEDWREPYATVAAELNANLPLDVDTAAEGVRDFIAAIDTAAAGR